jgi:hypothetical protein
MNPSQYTSVGVTAAVLTPVIMWLFHWPLTAPTEAQAGGIAALLIGAAGAIHSGIGAWLTRRSQAGS